MKKIVFFCFAIAAVFGCENKKSTPDPAAVVTDTTKTPAQAGVDDKKVGDDCDFIRAAIAALPPQGGAVSIPAGTYNCSAPIIIDRDNVIVRGAGEDKVTIRLTDHVHAPMIIIGDPHTIQNEKKEYVAKKRVQNIEVSDLTLDGNQKNHDPKKECGEATCDDNADSVRNNGITIRGATNVTVENVTAHSMISGGLVTEKHCRDLRVRNFTSYNNVFDGLAGYETENSDFSNLYLHNNIGAGISLDIQFNNNVIRDSKLHDNKKLGIFARDLKGNHFIRIDIQRSGEHGIFLANAKSAQDAEKACAIDNTFDSVIINGSKQSGFRMNDACEGNSIVGPSNLCDNKEGGVSESDEAKGSVIVSTEVVCVDK